MTEAPGFFSRNFKLTASLLIGFCLVVLALCARTLLSGSPPRDEPVAEERAAEHRPTVDEETAVVPPKAGKASASTPAAVPPDLDTIRQMERSAADLYKTLRKHSRENPEADDALSEQEIRDMERAGAIVM